MTALEKYQRLECTGLWRDQGGGPRREVLVTLGDATLVIADSRTTRALAHWSLPAVERVNPGLSPARFAPGADALEELEIDDADMIAALSKVHSLIEARRPHPGRLRLALMLGALAVVLLIGLFWLPGAIIRQATKVVPSETRADIGHSLMTDVFRVTGAACTAPEGRAALTRLSKRLFPRENRDLIVLATGLAGTRHLPGGTILIGRALVENSPSPDAFAGYVLAEAARGDSTDPLGELLSWVGTRASLGLLTTGSLNPDRLVGYAEVLLTRPESAPSKSALSARFSEASADPKPWAAAAGIPDQDRDAIAGTGANAPVPIMADSDWVAIQGICAG